MCVFVDCGGSVNMIAWEAGGEGKKGGLRK